MRKWRNALAVLTGFDWAAVIAAGVIDYQARDPSTSETIGAHVTTWFFIGLFALFGLRTFTGQTRIGGAQRLLVASVAVAVIDAVCFYFIGIFVLHISVESDRGTLSYFLLSGISLLTMLATPTAFVALIVASVRSWRRRREEA